MRINRAQSLPSKHQGFTLIEVIVVVLIIGIIVSFASLSISGRSQQDRLNNEARRLTELLRLASDEAVLQGLELGLREKESGKAYEFLVIGEESRWLTYETDGPLRERRLPDGIQLQLTAEGYQPPPSSDDEENIQPNLLFLSSGELTPFEILLKAEGAENSWTIRGNLVGKIESLQAENEANKDKGKR